MNFCFIKDAFQDDDLLNVTYEEVLSFVRERCNDRLNAVGYADLFHPLHTKNSIGEWFYPMTLGTVKVDFFAEALNGGAYSATAGSDLQSFDFSSL